MPELDDLLREFRAEVPPPAPGAAERIAARARAAVPDQQASAATSARLRAPRKRTRARLALGVAAAAAVAAAVTLVVALSPGSDGGGPSPGSLLERAEAAVTPREQILALTIRLHETTRDRSVIPADRERDILMREYVLAGAGDALATRLLITEGPSGAAPTDEDSTLLLDRDGKLVEGRSWTPPAGAGAGLLSVDTYKSRRVAGNADPTLTGMLRAAYEDGALRRVGPRDGDYVLLRGHVIDGGCGHTDVWLDRHTFIPRRIEVAFRKVDFRSHKCDPGPPVQRAVWTIDSQRLEADDRGRQLLEVGDWPTARYELNGKRVGRDELPKRPPLDQR